MVLVVSKVPILNGERGSVNQAHIIMFDLDKKVMLTNNSKHPHIWFESKFSTLKSLRCHPTKRTQSFLNNEIKQSIILHQNIIQLNRSNIIDVSERTCTESLGSPSFVNKMFFAVRLPWTMLCLCKWIIPSTIPFTISKTLVWSTFSFKTPTQKI